MARSPAAHRRRNPSAQPEERLEAVLPMLGEALADLLNAPFAPYAPAAASGR